MPTHYLMLSFDDFNNNRDAYRNYLAQKAFAAGGGYTMATFEQLADRVHSSRVKFAIRKATGNKLKVLLHGHGDGHHDVITNDAGTAQRDTTALTNLLGQLLQGRTGVVGNASNTVVVMLSVFLAVRSTEI